VIVRNDSDCRLIDNIVRNDSDCRLIDNIVRNDSDCRLIDNKYSDCQDHLDIFYSIFSSFLKDLYYFLKEKHIS
jgi:hypothetical protein